jgi:Bacterial regulatory helix-turn-helix proteins, AraC family
VTKTGQPLSDIAYACGFRDYTHFARGFRKRFGTAPPSEQAQQVVTTHGSAPTLGKSKGPLRCDAASAPFGQREPKQQWATIPKVRNTPNSPMDVRLAMLKPDA